MAENTKIEWADHTFNPWIGCTKVGPGCDHCYAERQDRHRKWTPAGWGDGAPRHRTSEANWEKPLRWDRDAERLGIRYRVFCASLADVFDNKVDPDWRADLFRLISQTPHLDWLLLTKRISNAKSMIDRAMTDGHLRTAGAAPWPWPNVWLGATIVNQEEADRDIQKLLKIPATVHFLSMEPLLGPVDLAFTDYSDGMIVEKMHDIDWVIVGGESGPHAREMRPNWARSIRDQCRQYSVPFLFKQWGEYAPSVSILDSYTRDLMFRVGKKKAGRELDGETFTEFPAYNL